MNISKQNKWLGIVVILASGLIHLYDAPGEYGDAPYMGILFYLFFVGSIISAVGIYRGELIWGWLFGGLLSIGAVVGYLISRTVGMPISGIEDWGPPLAYFAIFLELVYFVSLSILKPVYSRRQIDQ